jgi:hypothetical protein
LALFVKGDRGFFFVVWLTLFAIHPKFLAMRLESFSTSWITFSNFTTSGATDGKERFSRE